MTVASRPAARFIVFFILFVPAVTSQERGASDAISRIRALRIAQAASPTPAVLIDLALAYADARQFRLFEATMKQAQHADGGNGAPAYYLGRYYSSVRDEVHTAEHYFRQALERNPEDFRSLYHLGYCDEVQARPAEAEARYRVAIKLVSAKNAAYAEPWIGMARLLLTSTDPKRALPFAQQAAETPGAPASAFRTLARCLIHVGRPSDAAQALTRASQLEPTDASTLYSLYRVLAATGDQTRAREVLHQFRRLSVLYARE
ncbi:MAG TPA: tetratricopeptide repeat protein [Bryobacteraceae bacterium]|nr:tetratricopeptide repeat protein [Bryobacteraceae bacterium]